MLLTYLAWSIFLFGLYALYSNYRSLPDQVPTLYDFDGSVKSKGPKSMLYILEGIAFLTGLLMTTLMFSEKVEEATLVLESSHVLTQLLFAYIIYQTIKIVNGKADGLGVVFYALVIASIVLPLSLALLHV